MAATDDDIDRLTIMTLNCGNYGIFLTKGDAGFLSSTVGRFFVWRESPYSQWPFPGKDV